MSENKRLKVLTFQEREAALREMFQELIKFFKNFSKKPIVPQIEYKGEYYCHLAVFKLFIKSDSGEYSFHPASSKILFYLNIPFDNRAIDTRHSAFFAVIDREWNRKKKDIIHELKKQIALLPKKLGMQMPLIKAKL